MKTWRLISGILSIVLSLVILLQSCAVGMLEAMGADGSDSADTAPDCPYNQIGINRRAEADDRGDGIEHHEGNAPAAAAVSGYNRNNTSCNQEQSDE